MNRKITILSILFTALFVIVASVIYFVFFKKSPNQVTNDQTYAAQQKRVLGPCLADDEYADYPRKNKDIAVLTSPLSVPVVVSVYDKESGEKKDVLNIADIQENHYHPIELHRCGVYATRIFNFDWKLFKPMPGFAKELWQYSYDGLEKKIFTFSALNPILFFNDDFRIDFEEKFISLTRGYSSKDNYALVIKDLKTLKDAFVLPVADIIKQNPDVVGDVSFENGGWSLDGKYFWFSLNQGADIAGFVRVNTKDWSYKIFPAPQRTMGGDAFNINTGMVTYGADVAPWSGVVEVDEQLRKEAAQTGQISSFYIHNLFTKQKYLVATTTDPTYYFRPQWLSDTELQYELPSGEKKVYNVK